MGLASQFPALYQIAGGADPIQARVDQLELECGSPLGFRKFSSDTELLKEKRFADIAIIGTQDALHVQPCLSAMENGYDILLEKPIATNVDDILKVQKASARLGRKVLVCHVLRYTPFYRKAREIVKSGVLGDIVSINATEGVKRWHQAHAYVRGHWAVTEKATPMIVAKCCHDLDIILWLMDDRCKHVASFGSLTHFTAANAPIDAPARCTDGCPVAAQCQYNALHYISTQRKWLRYIYENDGEATDAEITQWLTHSPWGRCVYHCDNSAVDRQVVAMEFAQGGCATLTMTAFEDGRHLEIFGTKGVLRGGAAVKATTGADIILRTDEGIRNICLEKLEGGYSGHGGGDIGLIQALYQEMRGDTEMTSSLAVSVESHVIGFAAEEARKTGTVQTIAN